MHKNLSLESIANFSSPFTNQLFTATACCLAAMKNDDNDAAEEFVR
jgi:hypothetical protein